MYHNGDLLRAIAWRSWCPFLVIVDNSPSIYPDSVLVLKFNLDDDCKLMAPSFTVRVKNSVLDNYVKVL